jgi:uncharacterized membrane protein YoaK (UPF0700 family)
VAVGQYTSHVTGAVSSITDHLVLGQIGLATTAVAGVVSFLLGAMTCAIMVNLARRQDLSSEYALPLLLEALLILTFGLAGSQLTTYRGLLLPVTVVLLSFLMGLQNAMVTKLSGNVIRTTHMTGSVTDLGIELGKLVYWNRQRDAATMVLADRERIRVLGGLLFAFIVGGVTGAFGFKHVGYGFSVPIALLLAVLARCAFHPSRSRVSVQSDHRFRTMAISRFG